MENRLSGGYHIFTARQGVFWVQLQVRVAESGERPASTLRTTFLVSVKGTTPMVVGVSFGDGVIVVSFIFARFAGTQLYDFVLQRALNMPKG